MSMGAVTGGGKRKRRQAMADINVTPLVDVMLVLLVIFMITAPALKESIDVDLPRVGGGTAGTRSLPPFAIVIDAEGRVHANGTTMQLSEVPVELPKVLKGHSKEALTLKAHRKLPYDTVVKVIATIRAAGVTGINIAVDRD